MRAVFEAILNMMAKKEDCVLVTVVQSFGSAPREAGARMLVGKEGRLLGTIGGGMIEHRSEELAIEALFAKKTSLKKFTLAPNDVEDLGMICGGRVEVLFQFLNHQDECFNQICEAALTQINAHKDAWLITKLTGDVVESGFYSEATGFLRLEVPVAQLQNKRMDWKEGASRNYTEPVSQSGKVYIFGGGHVAQALVPVLALLDFYTVVYDDRPVFLTKEFFPEANEFVLGSFDDIGQKISLTKQDYVVVMTRKHKTDFALEVQLLKTPAYYIGVIGSKHKVALQQERLQGLGFAKEEIARLTMPIGIAIQAETPAEIAISIAGQLIQKRAQQGGA